MATERKWWPWLDRVASIAQLGTLAAPAWWSYAASALVAVVTAVWANVSELTRVSIAVNSLVAFAASLGLINQVTAWRTRSARSRLLPPGGTIHRKPFATREQLTERVLRDLSVRVVDLTTVDDFRVQDRVFEGCDFYGPAVITFGDNIVLRHCAFEGSADDMFIEVPPRVLKGVIAFQGCVLQRCLFTGISIIGPPELTQMLIDSFGGNRN